MLIDCVRAGWMGKYFALSHGVQTSLSSVCMPRPRAKYFPLRPSTQSISTHSISDTGKGTLYTSDADGIVFSESLRNHVVS